MKLILKNFRCFANLTLDLPDKGMVLLWGNSGIGKSTLLKAIHFVLFGKELRVLRTGEKKCSVTLIWTVDPYGTWEFCRTKGPTHFRLTTPEGSFEDDVAQQMVHNRFGDYFILTNYIAQKSVNSFFGLSNTEKTSFLHHLTIQQFDVDSLKSRLRNKIKDRRTALTSIASEVQTYRRMLDQETRVDCPLFPLKRISSEGTLDEQIQATISDEQQRRTKNEEKLQHLKLQEQDLQRLQMAYEQSRPMLLQLRETLTRKEQELFQQQDLLPDELDTQEIETSLYQVQSSLKICRQYLDYLKSVDRYQTKQQDILDHLQSQRMERQSSLDTLPSACAEELHLLQRQLKECQISQRLLTQINGWLQDVEEESCQTIDQAKQTLQAQLISLQQELTEYDTSSDKVKLKEVEAQLTTLQKRFDDLELQLKGQRLSCPSCKVNVLLRQQCLHPFDEKRALVEKQDLIQDIKKKKKEVETWSSSISQKESNAQEVKSDLQTIRSYLTQTSSIENKVSRDISINEMDLQIQIKSITVAIEQRKQWEQELRSIDTQIRQIDQHPQLIKLKVQTITLSQLIKAQRITLWIGETPFTDNPTQLLLESWIETQVVQVGKLQSKLEDLRQIQQQRKDILSRIQKINTEIKQANIQIQEYESYSSQDFLLQDIRQQIVSRQEKSDKFTKRQKRVEEYMIQKERYDRQQKIEEQWLSSQSRERIAQRALEKAEMLIDCVQQAENVTLETCLDHINSEVEDYLQQFFPDTDFQLSLFSYRETKDGDKKSCIDIRIQRDGESFPLDCLSGGQFDLMCLALFLAFNKVSNKEMLMLDECLSSLHSDAVEDIIEIVKEKYKDRLILFTLHQANTGLFDHIIDVHQLVAH